MLIYRFSVAVVRCACVWDMMLLIVYRLVLKGNYISIARIIGTVIYGTYLSGVFVRFSHCTVFDLINVVNPSNQLTHI